MDASQQMIEIEAIKRLKARYFRCMDTKDWESWLGVFTEDATLKFDRAVSTGGQDGESAPTLIGRAGIADYVPKSLATAQTVHHGHMPEIDILSETAARGIWAMEDIVDYGPTVTNGFGHYHETYRKEDGDWRIASVHLTRIRLSQTGRDRIRL